MCPTTCFNCRASSLNELETMQVAHSTVAAFVWLVVSCYVQCSLICYRPAFDLRTLEHVRTCMCHPLIALALKKETTWNFTQRSDATNCLGVGPKNQRLLNRLDSGCLRHLTFGFGIWCHFLLHLFRPRCFALGVISCVDLIWLLRA